MKILFFNGADVEGGAAKAATRLLHGLHAQGGDVRLYVQRRQGTDPLIGGPTSLCARLSSRVRPAIEQLLCGINPKQTNGPFCAACLPDGLARQATAAAPDIIHLHWVARMMRLETLSRLNVPLVWTMHDSWAFTGGCYLPGDCTRYRDACGTCPILNSCTEADLSRRIWQRKDNAWRGLNLTIVAPSRWMAASARSSSLFRDTRIEVIPNGVDVHLYRPIAQQTARARFSLPNDRKLILFGAKSATQDRNKGFHLYAEALRKLAGVMKSAQVELIIFGSAEADKIADLGFTTHYLGRQGDDVSLAHLYSAADVFVLPSLQESLGYTVMEAMACGTPCVAFDQGGVPDLIDHGHNGYLAQPYDPTDLAHGIAWVLADNDRWEAMSRTARMKIVDEFAITKVAKRHLELYGELAPV